MQYIAQHVAYSHAATIQSIFLLTQSSKSYHKLSIANDNHSY